MDDPGRFLETFLVEANELLELMEEAALGLEGSDRTSADGLARLFRAVHTLKGSGAMLGFDGLSGYAHEVETLLDNARNGRIPITAGFVDMVLAARDRLRDMVRDISGQGNPGSKRTYGIAFRPPADTFRRGIDPVCLLDELRDLGECNVRVRVSDLPPLESMDPESSYLSWDITLVSDEGIDAVNDVFMFMEPDCFSVSVGDGCVNDESVPGVGTTGAGIDGREPAVDTIRVPSDKLDQLVNIVGELVINTEQLEQLAQSVGWKDLASTVEVVEGLVGGLRDLVLNIRMVPIGSLFNRYRRSVRDIARELGKEVRLVVFGGETEMDKTLVERLNDPLLHLIRNGMDHGMESVDERLAAGKPREGTIRLNAEHHGNSVIITVEDDGRGLDYARIRQKAVDKGFIEADENPDPADLFELVFQPGFSTADHVTALSGRGVGMDVVKREVTALRGSVRISSIAGTGTTIIMSLPLTLAIIDGLVVEADGNRYVLPVSIIEECMDFSGVVTSRKNMMMVRDVPIPLIRLREVFMAPEPRGYREEIVVIGASGHRVGIVVDRVIGDYQTVIKPLGHLYRKVEGISGATIMGDGRVSLILDTDALIRLAMKDECRRMQS